MSIVDHNVPDPVAKASTIERHIEEALKLSEAASGGPWRSDGCDVLNREDAYVGYPPQTGCIASLDDGEYISNANAGPDSAFMAYSRTMLRRFAIALSLCVEILRGVDGPINPDWEGIIATILDRLEEKKVDDADD